MRPRRNKSEKLQLFSVEWALVVSADCEQCGTLFTTSSNTCDVRRVCTDLTCLKDPRRHDLKFKYYLVQNAVMMVYFAVFRNMSMDVSTCFKIFSNFRGMPPLQSTPDTDRRSPHSLSSGVLSYKGKENLMCVLRATTGAVGDEKMASSTHARRKIHEGYHWLSRGEQLFLPSSWRLRFSTECTPIFQTVLFIKVDTMRTSENTMYSSTFYILHYLPTPFNFLTSPGSARDSFAVSGCDVAIVEPKRHRSPRQSIAWPIGWWRRNTKETCFIDREHIDKIIFASDVVWVST